MLLCHPHSRIYTIILDTTGLNEFESFLDVYTVVSEYMQYYNQRRMHGSLKYMAPSQSHQVSLSGSAEGQVIVAYCPILGVRPPTTIQADSCKWPG
ncbi:MAG: IS3 family transposase [Limnochordia bacterium]